MCSFASQYPLRALLCALEESAACCDRIYQRELGLAWSSPPLEDSQKGLYGMQGHVLCCCGAGSTSLALHELGCTK